jgi:sugar phosphate isomerase/epimerase
MNSYVESAKICDQIGAEILVIHPGSVFGGKFFRAISNEILLERVKNLLDIVAQKYPNVKVCIENMPKVTNYFLGVEEIALFLDELNREDIFMTWDTSHSWTCDVNLKALWEKFHKIIKNIHLVDNKNKESDKHPALGTASVNFREVFDLIKQYNYNDALIIEISSAKDLTESIAFVKKLL